MTEVRMTGLTREQKFRLVTGSVVPRPIALVTTLNADASCNAAPFSAFNYMSDDPPLLAIGFDRYAGESRQRNGEIKDTLHNILRDGEFVVNMVDEALIRQAVACGTDYPFGVSEIGATGLSLTASTLVRVPRVTSAPIAWECRSWTTLDLGPARTMLIGEIISMYFQPGLLDETRMKVRADLLSPVGRLGGPNYAVIRDRLEIPIKPYPG